MSQARSGGISTLTRLGSVDGYGNATQLGAREWSNADNGNPDNMINFTRGFLGDEDILFIVERDLNRNVCYYSLDEHKVVPTWLMIPDDVDLSSMTIEQIDGDLVSEEALTMLERRGYGVDVLDPTHFTVRALKGEVFTIRRDDNGNARAYIHIDHRDWQVRRVMIHTKPSMLGFPSVREIHIEVEDGGRITQFFFGV
jgi:hypothetical protein